MFNGLEVFVVESAGGKFTHGFEGRHNGEVFAFVAARLDCSPINVNGGHVGSGHGNHASRHILIATANDNHTIHPLTVYTGLNAVGNDLARDQGILHALGSHSNAVRNGGGSEDLRVGPGGFNCSNRRIGKWLKATVARGDGGVTVGNSHHRLFKVFFLVAHGVIHGAVGSPGNALGDILGSIVIGHSVS